MVHVGVDLHKRSSQLAVLMPDGEVTQRRLESDPKRLEQFFTQVPRGARIAIEASGTWWWFVDLVERLGHHVVLSRTVHLIGQPPSLPGGEAESSSWAPPPGEMPGAQSRPDQGPIP
jgi:hypothetical protein